jgi:hypothetical protein
VTSREACALKVPAKHLIRNGQQGSSRLEGEIYLEVDANNRVVNHVDEELLFIMFSSLCVAQEDIEC